MRKAIVMLLLVVVSGSAGAAWVKIDGTDDETTYADPATIRKAGNMVKMWSRFDFKTVKVWLGLRYVANDAK